MKREEYIQNFLKTYQLVKVLADKNDSLTIQVRHKKIGKDLVLRSFSENYSAYSFLLTIKCKNLPEIYDVISCDDGQIILEEYINGITVSQAIEATKYRFSTAKKVIYQLCNALSVLHANSIIHRDLKPDNVMITADGRVVLIDFNASRTHDQSLSKDTVIMGTVGYAPPEQLGLAQTDARTDIYALGIMLNVMLTGVHPSKKLPRGHAGKIVRKCTALSPDERYQSAQKLSNAL